MFRAAEGFACYAFILYLYGVNGESHHSLQIFIKNFLMSAGC